MMASQQRSASVTGTKEKTYFELQREELIGEIAMVRARPIYPLRMVD
jgi:DASH complex subunit DAD1